MKVWKLLLPVPFLAALSMVPQGQEKPAPDETAVVIQMSELRYTTQDGATQAVSARNVVEVRLLTDLAPGIRLELLYDNGDYSMIDAQAFHLLRNAGGTREVKLVRGKVEQMRFPRLP
jgi:hypothetical protein